MTRRILSITALFLTLLSAIGQDAEWMLEAEAIDPNEYFGVTSGNGMIGIVSSPQPLQVQDIVLNGVFDLYQRGRVSNILKGFNFLNMNLAVDGVQVSAENISGFTQVLDMRTGKIITTFEVPGKVRVTQEIMALRHLPYSALMDVKIEALGAVAVAPMNMIDAPNHLRDVRNHYSVIERPHIRMPLMSSVALSPTGKHTLAASVSYIVEEEEFFADEVTHIDWDYNRHWMTFRKNLKKGETFDFALVGSVISSVEVDDPFNEAERLTLYAQLEGRERLLQRHNAAWGKLWESDIIVEGNEEDQRDIHSFIYHLYAFARAGTAYSMSPMGLSGLGYNGHVFWDTEIWMFPPLLMLQPEIAKSLLEYRWEMLPQARYNAFAHGYKGAQFPWESAETGQEATPVWALTGPFQHHITADVGWAFWKYYQVTKDKAWLASRGYPMLKEVADFWVSRVERTAPGRFEIKNVVGADEYAENIDNDAYTNGMAITVLRYATEAAQELGIEANPDWNYVADNIVIEQQDGVTMEHSTYKGEIIKQADVNLLAYPLNIITGDQIEADLNYYIPKYDPLGPAMGFCTIATIQARLGQIEKAYQGYKDSYKKNEVPPFGVLAETAGGTNPYFATGAGGVLQTVLSGFGGLDFSNDGVVQSGGKLPKAWKKLTFKGIGGDEKTFEVKN